MGMIDEKSSREGSRIYREQLITLEDLEVFKTNLLHEIKALLKDGSAQPEKKWLKSSEVKKMLGISAGTLQNLRINGTLSYSKIGGIIFYNHDGITKLLDSNSNHP
jgi:hypothetical protein